MRDAQLTINRSALLHNLRQVKLAAPHAKVLAMVKADAYGHGALVVAETLSPHVDALGVAFLEEALALRMAGIRCPIAILEGVFSTDELAAALSAQCYLVVHQPEQITLLHDYRGELDTCVWLKIDSGMHRLGLSPQAAIDAYQQLNALAVVKEIILTSHFACADDLQSAKTRQQMAVFEQLSQALPITLAKSIANSAGILAWPETHYQWVRPGIMLYGSSPFADKTASELNLQPVMTLSSRLIAIQQIKTGETVGYGSTWQATQDTRLGVVAMGYGDGYPRHIGRDTCVLINGQRAAIVGRVSMDMMTVDITHISAERGDAVLLWGDGLTADEIAASANTISYELFCQATMRAERFVV